MKRGKDRKSFRKKILLALALLVALYVCVEVVSLAGLFLLEHLRSVTYKPYEFRLSDLDRAGIDRYLSGERGMIDLDPELGWVMRAGGVTPMERINAQGIRSDREYSAFPEEGKIRFSAFGDSFVFSQEVKNAETWEERLVGMLENVEVLNFGVGAYGLDQAYLRYGKSGKGIGSHLVFIGFNSNYYGRNITVYPPAMYAFSGVRCLPFTKPRFIFEGDELVLLENPLSSPGDYERLLEDDRRVLSAIEDQDHYLQIMYRKGALDFLPSVRLFKMFRYHLLSRYPENRLRLEDWTYSACSDSYRITCRLLIRFYHEVIRDGALPVILIFPQQKEIELYWAEGIKVHQALLGLLDERGFYHVDLLGAFEAYRGRDDLETCFEKGGHYSAEGNRLVAEYVKEYLVRKGLADVESIERAREAERPLHSSAVSK
jgi:hypothetical protein